MTSLPKAIQPKELPHKECVLLPAYVIWLNSEIVRRWNSRDKAAAILSDDMRARIPPECFGPLISYFQSAGWDIQETGNVHTFAEKQTP